MTATPAEVYDDANSGGSMRGERAVMKDWLAFFLFNRRGPWQKWATRRVQSWWQLPTPPA